MINTAFYDCAATYLYKSNIQLQNRVETKRVLKVEPVHSVNTGKRFNPSAGEKANHNHIDICI